MRMRWVTTLQRNDSVIPVLSSLFHKQNKNSHGIGKGYSQQHNTDDSISFPETERVQHYETFQDGLNFDAVVG